MRTFVFFCLLLTCRSYAQFSWHLQNSGVTVHLNSTCFTSKTVGWVAGDQGAILHTTDAGMNWILQNSNEINDLNGITFFDNTTGWCVGDNGVILKTHDGGTSWQALSSGVTNNLYSISCSYLDPNILWACGDATILFSSDGGSSWTQQFNLPNSVVLYSIEALNSNEAWTVGEQGVALHTVDSGVNWVIHTTLFADDYFDVNMFNGSYGWMVGDNGKINNTVDGGTWLPQTSNTTEHMHAISFYDTLNAVIVGHNGTLLQTSDGGFNWNIQSFPSPENLNDVIFFDDSTAVVVADNGKIYRSPGNVPQNSPDTTAIDDRNQIGDYNLITPNGDGRNDLLYLNLKNEPENIFILYNRLGVEVHRIINYDNNLVVWDGTDKNGRPLCSSTYFYVFKIPEIGFVKSDWVELIR
ncbi:MAG: gliding motility-associated C-terminal domain-containing protein [Flavobacteriales bacterium]|nr:gliding motility-associated C-terminal domain-containing protein [Flavobacteriales bacterium]